MSERSAWSRLFDRPSERLLEHLRIDPAWGEVTDALRGKGPIVYVLRSASVVDAWVVMHLVERSGLPPIGYSSELSRVLTWGYRRRPRASLEEALLRGESAILFLKQSPGLISLPRSEPHAGDDQLAEVLELQARLGKEIMLLPLTLIWTKTSERRGFSLLDAAFGPTDRPGDARALLQFFLNFKEGALRTAEALSLKEFTANDREPEPARVRRLTYALLRRLERERRTVVGPARKTPDRVRHEVLRSPRLVHLMRDMAAHGNGTEEEIRGKADTLLQELSATPNADLIGAIEPLADALVAKVFAAIDVDKEGIERVREAAKRGGVVLLPSHKSHVDYLVLSYIFRKHLFELPLIASGDNLSFFPVGGVLRRGGAFFIRRSFRGDKLYAAVVDAYIRRLIRDGWAIEFFLEGGRSRTGKLLPPQVGLLNLVVDAALDQDSRPLAFVPISIGYERTMEESEFVREKAGGSKEKESIESLLSVGTALLQKYGRVNVQFGQIIDLHTYRAARGDDLQTKPNPAKRRALVTQIAHQVMGEINHVTAVTAGALVAMALLDMEGRGLSHRDLVARSAVLSNIAERAGARPSPHLVNRTDTRSILKESSIREATRLFVKSELVRQHFPDDALLTRGSRGAQRTARGDAVFSVPEDARERLELAKNSILHFFVDRSFVSIAALTSFTPERGRAVEEETLLEQSYRALSSLFEHEFAFRSALPAEESFRRVLADMIDLGELQRVDGRISFGPGAFGLDGRELCIAHAAHVRSSLEAYRAASRTLRVLLGGPLDEKDLTLRALSVGRQMFLGGEIDRKEALSRPTIETAWRAFQSGGQLEKKGDQLRLTSSFQTEDAVRGIELGLVRFIPSQAGSQWNVG